MPLILDEPVRARSEDDDMIQVALTVPLGIQIITIPRSQLQNFQSAAGNGNVILAGNGPRTENQNLRVPNHAARAWVPRGLGTASVNAQVFSRRRGIAAANVRARVRVGNGPASENQNSEVAGTATAPVNNGLEAGNINGPMNNPMTRDEIMSMWLSRLQTGIEPEPISPIREREPIYRYPGRVMMHPEHERIVRRMLGKERIMVPPIQKVAGGPRPQVQNTEPPKPLSAYIKLWTDQPRPYIPLKYRRPPRPRRTDRPPNPDLYIEKAQLEKSQRWLDTRDRLIAVAGRRLLRYQLIQINVIQLPPGQPTKWDTHCNYILWTSRGTVSMITERLQTLFCFEPALEESFVAERLNGKYAIKHAEFLKEFAPGETHSIQRAEARIVLHKAKRDDPEVRNGSQAIEVEQFDYEDPRYEKPKRLQNAPVDWNRDDDALLFLYLGQNPRKFMHNYGWVFKGKLTDPFVRVRMGQVTHLGFTESELARARERYEIIQANVDN